jgi:hypothetical protein
MYLADKATGLDIPASMDYIQKLQKIQQVQSIKQTAQHFLKRRDLVAQHRRTKLPVEPQLQTYHFITAYLNKTKVNNKMNYEFVVSTSMPCARYKMNYEFVVSTSMPCARYTASTRPHSQLLLLIINHRNL